MNNLPREIIIEILRFLPGGDLKNASLACKQWNTLIEATCLWSIALNSSDKEEKINFIRTTDRKFGTIKITHHLNEYNRIQVHEIFRKHGANVHKLILSQSRVENVRTFADLLTCTPNLKHAVLNTRHILAVRDLPPDHVLPNLKKLKKLELRLVDQGIIKCFGKAKLATLEIEEMRLVDFGALSHFLLSQDMLTSLTVKNYWSPRSTLVDMEKLNHTSTGQRNKLALSMLETAIGTSYDHDQLMRYVKSQMDYRKQMEMGNFNRTVPSTVYECVSAMPKLDTLNVSIGQIPWDKDIYAQLEENRSVRTIELWDDCVRFNDDAEDDVQFLSNFLAKFPNVRRLILRDTDVHMNKKILAMTTSLSKLESLSIDEFDESLSGCVNISNLKSLRIQHLRGKIDWSQFTKTHTRLVELTVSTMGEAQFFTTYDIDQMASSVDLQSLRLGDGFVADDQFFEIIQEKCANLKVLDLHSSCIANGLRHNSVNALQLHDVI